MSSQASEHDLAFGKAFERVAAEVLAAELWPGAEVIERDTFAHIDFTIKGDEKPVAFLEVKRRRVASTDYEDTAVSWKKYLAGRNLWRYYGGRVLCLVVFTDRAGYFYLDELPDRKEFIGREDRDGEGCDHGFYSISRMEWPEGLLEAIKANAKE